MSELRSGAKEKVNISPFDGSFRAETQPGAGSKHYLGTYFTILTVCCETLLSPRV